MIADSGTIQSVGQRPIKAHFNTNAFNVYNATSNYNHISLPAGTDKETVQLISNAGLDNFCNLNLDVAGINSFTRESGTLDGGVNFQPTSSFKHRAFFEENGFYPPAEKGWVA